MDCKMIRINLSTPICLLEITSCTNGLHTIKRIEQSFNQKIYHLNDTENIDNKSYPKSLIQAFNWFRQYFDNNYGQPDLDLYDLMKNNKLLCRKIQLTNFKRKTYLELLKNIQYGQCSSYSELSKMVINNNHSARAIGTVMKNNPLIIMIPCHRIIKKSGIIGKYAGEEDPMKRWLIEHEKTTTIKPRK
ncbi:hypothetical protein DERP_006939 [Dermatophagoides pteronyssinus]|uniref:Uncharacterized protein n=2 Tax=Dermatophagoides pteronyssinus TaxID=6956 RepID=A0ABQ8JU62_DERPT|nr:methylated-DNA--protein-cysteine methyltransferase-like [Dermatophagoides pteronyssinus]KAH9426000.1 hypothetical protein DERP_006939 [Dermatophagoides pteronyssinus]